MNAKNSTADRIKQAALKMFAESGYEGASLSEIAKEVGIKTPSIYAHYKSKEQLFLQLINEVIAEERQQYTAMLEAVREEPAHRQLYRLFDFFTDLSHLTTGQAFLKRTILVPPRHLRDRLRQDFLRYEHELSDGLLKVWRKGAAEGIFHSQDEERMLAAFYVCVDGLLVENQLYEEELYGSRKQMVWLSLWQLWTLTARED
ncbi:TetR/AcrR family transcriptional regulator [Paenibacillus alkaliterrae]|uniref:TetR/AcrR family transcriptional regulator n=1 Tax=Paenibacillus alkaliterrae TaxID=320909 RepID=UPI001F2EC1DF|nr:TetR/AcrR family transcriptional regulator [Paenibacillus alkaliterrae]MCF2938429.1 TetR/AcrR family transcriptional regulator [Paenibacillus alkaliterrae]